MCLQYVYTYICLRAASHERFTRIDVTWALAPLQLRNVKLFHIDNYLCIISFLATERLIVVVYALRMLRVFIEKKSWVCVCDEVFQRQNEWTYRYHKQTTMRWHGNFGLIPWAFVSIRTEYLEKRHRNWTKRKSSLQWNDWYIWYIVWLRHFSPSFHHLDTLFLVSRQMSWFFPLFVLFTIHLFHRIPF